MLSGNLHDTHRDVDVSSNLEIVGVQQLSLAHDPKTQSSASSFPLRTHPNQEEKTPNLRDPVGPSWLLAAYRFQPRQSATRVSPPTNWKTRWTFQQMGSKMLHTGARDQNNWVQRIRRSNRCCTHDCPLVQGFRTLLLRPALHGFPELTFRGRNHQRRPPTTVVPILPVGRRPGFEHLRELSETDRQT